MANKSSKDGQTWLHHTVVRLVTDNIVRNDVVVPDFNVCTNTLFSYTSKHADYLV